MASKFKLSESQQTCETDDFDQDQFQYLLADVWATLEKNLHNDPEALEMLESFAVPSSQNFVLNRIESEFNLGPLGDYINKNVQTLPFLATVMAQIHQQLHIPSNDQKSQNQDPSQAMTSFWVELEEKLGANAKTFSTVEEISENARLAAEDLSKENPLFDSVLTDVKKCIKQAWGSLETEVDYCIRRVKRKRYSDKAMEKIYARLVKKGVQTARQIQDKIESVTAQKRVR